MQLVEFVYVSLNDRRSVPFFGSDGWGATAKRFAALNAPVQDLAGAIKSLEQIKHVHVQCSSLCKSRLNDYPEGSDTQ